MYDFGAAELSSQANFRYLELDKTTPKKPANVNDSDLFPTVLQAAARSTKPTEMIWCMLRSDLASFAATRKVKMHKLSKTVLMSDEICCHVRLESKV